MTVKTNMSVTTSKTATTNETATHGCSSTVLLMSTNGEMCTQLSTIVNKDWKMINIMNNVLILSRAHLFTVLINKLLITDRSMSYLTINMIIRTVNVIANKRLNVLANKLNVLGGAVTNLTNYGTNAMTNGLALVRIEIEKKCKNILVVKLAQNSTLIATIV